MSDLFDHLAELMFRWLVVAIVAVAGVLVGIGVLVGWYFL